MRPSGHWHETAWMSRPLVAYDTFTRKLRTSNEKSNRDVDAFRDGRVARSVPDRSAACLSNDLSPALPAPTWPAPLLA